MSKINAVLFGTHAVRAAWHNPARQVRALYITKEAMNDFQADLSVKGAKRPPPTFVDRKELDRATNNAVHQGIALDAGAPDEVFLQDLIIAHQHSKKAVLLMLDQLSDPHNVGAILRSAAAFSAGGVIMQRKGAPDLSGVLAKTACGAVEHMQVALETNLSRALEALQEAGWFAVGLDERGEKTIAELPDYEKVVLVLGAEGPGLRRNVAEHCDVLARLPTSEAMPSLNVSNAAAVALYALTC